MEMSRKLLAFSHRCGSPATSCKTQVVGRRGRSTVMSLTLYLHPLAYFCQKALIACYENGTPFTPHIVNLGDEAERAALQRLWPVGKFPLLRDAARGQTVPESSIIIEYLDRYYPGPAPLLPDDADLAWQTRLRDRFYDLYVHEPMQRIVGDRLRPRQNVDPYGVEEA